MRKQSIQTLRNRQNYNTCGLIRRQSKYQSKLLPLTITQCYVPCKVHDTKDNTTFALEEEMSHINNTNNAQELQSSCNLLHCLPHHSVKFTRLFQQWSRQLFLPLKVVKSLRCSSINLHYKTNICVTVLHQCKFHLGLQHAWVHQMELLKSATSTKRHVHTSIKEAIRYLNTLSSHKYKLQSEFHECVCPNDSNDECLFPIFNETRMLKLSSWYKKQMECKMITPEDIPHIFTVKQTDSQARNTEIVNNTLTFTESSITKNNNNNSNNTNGSRESITTNPTAENQDCYNTAIKQGNVTASSSSCNSSSFPHLLAFIIASLEEQMEVEFIESLCSSLNVHEKLYLLQHCLRDGSRANDKGVTISNSNSNSDSSNDNDDEYDDNNSNSNLTQPEESNKLLSAIINKLCTLLVNDFSSNKTVLTNNFVPVFFSLLTKLHEKKLLTSSFLEIALLSIWNCRCNSCECNESVYMQRIFETLFIAEVYLPHNRISDLLYQSQMYLESSAYASIEANEIIASAHIHSHYGLEHYLHKHTWLYIQSKINHNYITTTTTTIKSICQCYDNSKLLTLLQMMPIQLRLYTTKLLLYTLGRIIQEFPSNSVGKELHHIMLELESAQLDLNTLATTKQMVNYIHFTLEQGSRQTAEVLLRELHTKKSIVAVMSFTHNAGSTLTLHALHQLMHFQPSLEYYVIVHVRGKFCNKKKDNNVNINTTNRRHKGSCNNNVISSNERATITFHVQRDRVYVGNEMWLQEHFMSNNALSPFTRLTERELNRFHRSAWLALMKYSPSCIVSHHGKVVPVEQAMHEISLPAILAAIPLEFIDRVLNCLPLMTSDAFSYWAMCQLHARRPQGAMKILSMAKERHILPEMSVLVHLLEVCEELQLHEREFTEHKECESATMMLRENVEREETKVTSNVLSSSTTNSTNSTKTPSSFSTERKNVITSFVNNMKYEHTNMRKSKNSSGVIKNDFVMIFDIADAFVSEHFSEVAPVVFRAYVERYFTRHVTNLNAFTESDCTHTIYTSSCKARMSALEQQHSARQINCHATSDRKEHFCNQFIVNFILQHYIASDAHNIHEFNTSNSYYNDRNTQHYANNNSYKFMHSSNTTATLCKEINVQAIPLQWEAIRALMQSIESQNNNSNTNANSRLERCSSNSINSNNENVVRESFGGNEFSAPIDVIVRCPVTREINWWNSSEATSQTTLVHNLYKYNAVSLWPFAWRDVQHIITKELPLSTQWYCTCYLRQANNSFLNKNIGPMVHDQDASIKHATRKELLQIHRAIRLIICGCVDNAECLTYIQTCQHLFVSESKPIPKQQEQQEQQELLLQSINLQRKKQINKSSWMDRRLSASNELRAIQTLSLAAERFIRWGDAQTALTLLPPQLNETLPPQLRLIQLCAMQETLHFAELASLLLHDTIVECIQLLRQQPCSRLPKCTRNVTHQRKRQNRLCRSYQNCYCNNKHLVNCRELFSKADAENRNKYINYNSKSSYKKSLLDADKLTTEELLSLHRLMYKRPLRRLSVNSLFSQLVNE